MTFHYAMIKKIVEILPNASENHYVKEPQRVDGYCPDIIVKRNDGTVEVHEVEVINNKLYSANVKRVLWIAMNGKGVWDEVYLITDDGTYCSLEPLEVKCYALQKEVAEFERKCRELERKKRVLETKIKNLERTVKTLQLAKARKIGTIRKIRSHLDYDPIWDAHLLEELRKEIERLNKGKGWRWRRWVRRAEGVSEGSLSFGD